MADAKPYVPNQPGFNTFTPSLTGGGSGGPLLAGNGSPEGVVPGVPGQQYVDLLTQNQYTKFVGVGALGWQQTGKLATYLIITAGAS